MLTGLALVADRDRSIYTFNMGSDKVPALARMFDDCLKSRETTPLDSDLA